MSRCFPYPPLGYQKESMSIKIQKVEKFVTEGPKEKKEKERRKHRKVKKGESCFTDSKLHPERRFFSKKGEESEKSGLSEEHNEPVELLQNPCYLSDGIQSNKRKLDHSATPTSDGRPRNIIRLSSSRRQKEQDVSPSGEGFCSTSGRADSFPGQNGFSCSTQVTVQSKTGAVNGELTSPLETSEKKKGSAGHELGTSQFMLYDTEMQKAEESPYKALIEDWIPSHLQFVPDDCDDQEWLFRTSNGKKRLQSSPDVSYRASSTSWPQANYLPEADVYALPYTIPF